MEVSVESADKMKELGESIGRSLKGGEVIELLGDIGAGKTTFTKGLAKGLHVTEDVQSPTFTISRIYGARDGLELSHYDFYRLNDPGLLKIEISHAVSDQAMITVIEWGGLLQGVLPDDRLTVDIRATSEEGRRVDIKSGGEMSSRVLEALK